MNDHRLPCLSFYQKLDGHQRPDPISRPFPPKGGTTSALALTLLFAFSMAQGGFLYRAVTVGS